MREQFEAEVWALLGMTVGDSPIENCLFCAVEAWLTLSADRKYFRRLGYWPDFENDKDECWLFWEAQFQIASYRVDFVFCTDAKDGHPVGNALVVECDGHDFHERTKAQAATDRARDRALQDLGYTVYRFTGSEIYREPMKCALQILRWAGFVE